MEMSDVEDDVSKISDELVFFVNGKKISVHSVEPHITLTAFLRRHLFLTGTKSGCNEGSCGACTVMVSDYDRLTDTIRHQAVTSCLLPLYTLHGRAVTTVEGIGSLKSGLHPVQERISKFHGTQCGFCTPGMVMSMYTLLRNNPHPSGQDIENSLHGSYGKKSYINYREGKTITSSPTGSDPAGSNKYVVTGKVPHERAPDDIPHGARTIPAGVFIVWKISDKDGTYLHLEGLNQDLHKRPFSEPTKITEKECCCSAQASGLCGKDGKAGDCSQSCQDGGCGLTDVSCLIPYDPTQDLIFPPELQLRQDSQNFLKFKGRKITWYRPARLSEAVQLKSSNPDRLIAAGCTNIAQTLKQTLGMQTVIDVGAVRELRCESVREDGVEIGAALTMTRLLDLVTRLGDKEGEYRSVLEAVPAVLQSWGIQLRNSAYIDDEAGQARTCFWENLSKGKTNDVISQGRSLFLTIGGHIMLRKPVLDLVPLLVAGGCSIKVVSTDGQRRLPLDEKFFQEPSPVGPSDIVVSLWVPFTKQSQHVQTYRVATRKHQDYPSLSAAFVISFEATNKQKIERASLVFGGKIPSLAVLTRTKTFLEGRALSDDILGETLKVLQTECSALGLSDVEGFWAQGFLSKFFVQVLSAFKDNNGGDGHTSTSIVPTPVVFKTKQIFEIDNEGSMSEVKIVGQPLPHSTSLQQTTGEATFIDDIAPVQGELFIVPVLSRRPYAKLVSVDVSEALACPGIHGYIDHTDIPGQNFLRPGLDDGPRPIFVTNTVNSCGQTIGGIVSTDREAGQKSATLVKVQYEDMSPVILTVKDAIEANSFVGELRTLSKGETTVGFERSDHVTEGEVYIGGQKHMYLETQTCLVIPQEDHQFEVFSSCQMPHNLQAAAAISLGISEHKIMVRVKRIGGGFGGREAGSYLAALPAILAANKYGRPVRCVLDRKGDTSMAGGRHPLLAKYKAGYTNDGRILALEMRLYLNAGHVLGASQMVLDILMLNCDSGYTIPHMKLEGRCCRTNRTSNCPFRSVGNPQVNFVLENIVTRIATQLSMQPEKVREMNLYSEGDITVGDVCLKQCTLERCWQECAKLSDFDMRLQLTQDYNSINRLQKRGIAMKPVTFGIGIFTKFANQAGALVHIYTDGSVLVSHGGCEVGQGLHTKMRQIACETLGVPISKVIISETCTSMVPNATTTGASVNTDTNGLAVQSACRTLRERLRPFSESNPKGSWEDWVSAAYMDRVSLSTTGFCKNGDFGYDFVTGKGPAFPYYSYGVCCSEVEIDCLTGEHQLLRTDIVMDVGRSINPAIDIGQIEGGFVQGYGYYMMEEERYSEDGRLLTDSPLTYKMPLAADVPRQFNVALLKNSRNDNAVFSSRGIGEPPFLLSLSVHLAAQAAVRAAREDRGLDQQFVLESPATPPAIVKACTGGLSDKASMFPRS